MASAVQTQSFASVCELLKEAAHGEAAAFGGIKIWDLSREEFVAQKIAGLPLVAVPV